MTRPTIAPSHGYVIFQCENPACSLRFPAGLADAGAGLCPSCGGAMAIHEPLALSRKNDRARRPVRSLPHVELLLDNIRSTYNVGAIIRTADGAGAAGLHLCGITAQPTHPRVAKTSLGAAEALPWTYHPNAPAAGRALQEDGAVLWALEQTASAKDLMAIRRTDLPERLVLVLGHEVTGVDPALLDLCDRVVALPMRGLKESLNVAVACGAALYHFLHEAD